jgi:hypothetical protein
MGRVSIPIMAFRERKLPLVCAKTGRRADQMVAVQAVAIPLWTWWVLPFGPPLFLLVRWLMRRQVTGWLPMSRSAAARLRRVRRLGCASLLIGAASVLAEAVAGVPCLARVGLAALATAVAAGLFEPVWSVGARLDRSSDRVLLTRVHPAFCEAVAEDGDLSSGWRPDDRIRRASGDGK